MVGLQASAYGLAANFYNGSLVVSSSAGSQTLTIPVTYNVLTNYGSGNGSLTLSPNPVNMNYNTGGTAPTATVALTNSTASTFTASIQTNASNFLLIGPGGSCSQGQIFNVPISSGISLCTTSNILGLATGTYTATVLVTDSNNQSNTLTVNLTVNG